MSGARRRWAGLGLTVCVALSLPSCGGSGASSSGREGTWSVGAALHASREGGGSGLGTWSARLADGRILVAGGYRTTSGHFDTASKYFLKTVEIYDPKSKAWTETASMHQARFGAVVVALKTGQVLVAGGTAGDDAVISPSAELFDPAAGTWKFVEPMSACRVSATASVLASGDVLVVGGIGCDGKAQTSAQVYSVGSGSWTAAAPMRDPRWGQSATTLADGRVLVAGGRASPIDVEPEEVLASAEIFDPAANTWARAAPMHVPRVLHSAGLIDPGRVIVAGGHSQDPAAKHSATPTAELYDPAADTWTSTKNMSAAREEGGSVVLPDGTFLMAGGGQQKTSETYSPSTGAWSPAEPMHAIHDDAQLVLLDTGDVMVAGGFEMSPGHYSNTATVELFRPRKG
jgi:N-acetylneuraminic acid mutarotase